MKVGKVVQVGTSLKLDMYILNNEHTFHSVTYVLAGVQYPKYTYQPTTMSNDQKMYSISK